MKKRRRGPRKTTSPRRARTSRPSHGPTVGRAVEIGAPLVSSDGLTVVGIGASAGGLEAFSQVLEALPGESDLALVLVQHLAPQHESALPTGGQTTPCGSGCPDARPERRRTRT